MAEPRMAPYGEWQSPITAEMTGAGSMRLGSPHFANDGIYWSEGRPVEGGRNVIVRRGSDGGIQDVTPAGYNVRTRAHEYGGGSSLIHEGVIYFSNYDDQRLYRVRPGEEPEAISRTKNMRYADGVADPSRGRIILVREDHTSGDREAVNTLVSMTMDGTDERVLTAGYDFYSNPALSPDGSQLAWLSWNHPNMPWDGAELWVAEVHSDGTLGAARLVAGGLEESIFQPRWSPDGVLHFVSDRSGWWNLYRLEAGAPAPLYPMEAEFGVPQWVFGQSTYAFAGPTRLVCAYGSRGKQYLAVLDTENHTFTPIDSGYDDFGDIQAMATHALCVAASPTAAPAIVRIALADGKVDVLKTSSDITVDPGYLSTPQAIEFPTEGGVIAHAIFYPPRNQDFVAPEGQRPPVLVLSHGGPTGESHASLDLTTQYWTSRGFAVLDVNYRGSTGYGREYRERLNGQWGIADMEDCANAPLYLDKQGLVDGDRIVIAGGSAGGYTTLCALTFLDTFKAGASYYGVSDAEALATDTHKFESRYLDRMIGPYPEQRDVYRQRSPIHFADRISCPLILFQGLEDKVVPPAQAETMFEAVRARGIPVAYIPFEGEQHGFRRAENIIRSLEAEFYFYARVFGFTPADQIQPVEIHNL
ncbi:MAG: S9 family peptidase [Chloroflexota bacterium]